MKRFGRLSALLSVGCLVLAVLFAISAPVRADSFYAEGDCGENVTYMLKSDGTLVISGTGPMADYSPESPAPWHNLRLRVKSVVIEAGVTAIGDYAFDFCVYITDVTIPASVTHIGANAFDRISYLDNLHLPDLSTWLNMSLENFKSNPLVDSYEGNMYIGGQLLTEIVIPQGTTEIMDYAFHSLTDVTSVSIPESVQYIGAYAFNMCRGLKEVTIPDGVSAIEDYTFYMCISMTSVSIPSSVTSVGAHAFDMCYGLTSITLPEKATEFGDSAFANTRFTAISIPSGTKTIPASFLYGNCSLVTISIPESVTSVGESAFFNCIDLANIYITDVAAWMNLSFANENSDPMRVSSKDKNLYLDGEPVTHLVIPSGVTGIEAYRLSHCTFQGVTIPDTVTKIGSHAFLECKNLKEVTVPGSVKSLGNYIFKGCTSLESAILENGITTTGRGTFEDCNKLVSLDLAESVTTIGAYALAKAGVKELDLPDNLATIEGYAFYQNYALKSVTFPDSLTTLEGNAFRETRLLEVVTFGRGMPDIPGGVFVECSNLDQLNFADNTTSIGDYAFAGSSVDHVKLPDSCLSIGDYAFENCQVKTVDFGNGLKTIGDYAFYKCSLQHVDIPNSVETIGDHAFYYNAYMRTITLGTGVKSIEASIIDSYLASFDHVFYRGTEEQYAAIDIKYNTYLNGAMHHFLVEDVEYGDYMLIYSPTTNLHYLPGSDVLEHLGPGDYYELHLNCDVDTTYTGLLPWNEAVWYIKDGVLQLDHNGLVDFLGQKYYIKAGKWNKRYGLLKVDNSWVYLGEGIVQEKFEGVVEHLSTKVYITNGYVDFNKTDVVEYQGTLYYIRYGLWADTFDGMVKGSDGAWRYMQDGVFTGKYTGLAKNAVGWWYVKNGLVDTSYSGLVDYSTGTWYIKNGQPQMTYTGLISFEGSYWYIKGGMVQKTYTGIVSFNGGYWYVADGKVDFTYNGTYTSGNRTYSIVYGQATIVA